MLRAVSTLVCFLGAAQDPAPPVPESPPHILLLVADDLGWNGVGYHGGPVPTPHIDSLAQSGARLEHFYAQALCSPSRAALLTGRYPIRYGLQTGVLRPWAELGLDLDERLLPEALQELGYETSIAGKWHLGHYTKDHLPMQRGFEHQYGCFTGSIEPMQHTRMGTLDWARNQKPLRERGYVTERIADEVVRRIEERDPERSLFLYVPFTAPHTPHFVPPKERARFRHLEPKSLRQYAGVVGCLDDAIGRILAALDEQGLRDETLILFLSDNGAEIDGGDRERNAPLRDGKGELYEGGVRVPAVVSWPGRIEPGRVVDTPLHLVDLFPTLVGLAGGDVSEAGALDGIDAWPVLRGDDTVPRTLLLNVNGRTGAVRRGRWKLLRTKDGPTQRLELYDVVEDPGETRDLAKEQPDRVQELSAALQAFEAESVPAIFGKDEKPSGFQPPSFWGRMFARGEASRD